MRQAENGEHFDRVEINDQHLRAYLQLTESERRAAIGRELAATAVIASNAEAARQISKGRRLLLTGAAAGIVAICVGIGVYFATHRSLETKIVEAPVVRSIPNVGADGTGIAGWTSTTPDNKVMSNVTVFNSLKGVIRNPFINSLNAGHRYDSSNSDKWTAAWCYADFRRDGIDYTVNLSVRTRLAQSDQTVSANVMTLLDLSMQDIVQLRLACPWQKGS